MPPRISGPGRITTSWFTDEVWPEGLAAVRLH
jgi:hypothetical protein